MLKNWKKKMIAILLIFTMTFSNFALVGKTYAAYLADGIFGNKEDAGDTGSSNVEFDAYFKTSQDSKTSKSVSSDIKNNDLNIGVTVKVKNSGYLKDAKILFGNGKELNFVVENEIQVPIQTEEVVEDEQVQEAETEEMLGETSEELNVTESTENYETKNLVKENDKVQSFENNELYLVQLNANSEMNIEFPISYAYKKFVEEAMISKTNQIKFEGIYMNDNAEEIYVTKTVDLKLSWEDSREIETSSEITKYLGFNQDGTNGIILQNSITVDSSTEDASLPIKDSIVEVSVPVIDGVKPNTVNVVAKALVGTTGKENDEVVFGENNWNYDSENNKITIKVANQSELVSTQNENDILIDETAPMRNMYYSESGIDNYLITYTYKDVAVQERNIETTVNATLNEFGSTKLNSSNEINSELKDEVGDIVTYSNETTTNSVSKGYTYLNYNNEENKYEIEIDNKLIFNVSYKDIVEGLYYLDNGSQYIAKDGQVYEQNDLYYKTLTLNKDNFINMLGEEGVVNIYNNGELLYTINKDVQANDNNVIEIKFENEVKNIQIETSKPINDGNLIIGTVRAYSNVSYDKELYKNFDKLTINTVGRAKYIYVDNLVDSGNSNLDVKLDDTTTEATLEIGQDSLSTLAMNNNVELKVELNNEKISSDVYGNSRFQIKLPEYVESVDVTDYNIVYGEGLELSEVRGFVSDGRAYIDITVNGKQNALSSGIISKGTNIVLHANIKVNLFAPATEANFELTYINDDATNYNGTEGAGIATATVKYSAPSGVVSVNSISGYSESNKTITSVNQGKVQDEIAIYSESKTAKAELTIMNNEKNDISDIVILGRVPFKGVKDITTGEDLGTTLTAKMVSRIVPEDMNEIEFKYYYSENGEATTDLTDLANGWTDELQSLDNVKSFLIVPANSEYRMEKATKLRFTYNYEIPANLEHNEEIYGTFATFYTNNTEVATYTDVSKADIVGLITGEGPKFDFETTVDKTETNELESLDVTTTIKNKGLTTAEEIIVEVPVPDTMEYISNSIEAEGKEIVAEQNENSIIYKINNLEVDEEIKIITTLKVKILKDINVDEIVNSEIYSIISAKDLGAILKSNVNTIAINKSELKFTLSNQYNEFEKSLFGEGEEYELIIQMDNLKNSKITNVVVKVQLPEEFSINDENLSGEYDSNTRTITWKFPEVRAYGLKAFSVNLKVNNLNENITYKDLAFIVTGKADETKEYKEALNVQVGKPVLKVVQATSNINTYVKEGETIEYKFSIKNEGTIEAKNVKLVDKIPEGLVAKEISYVQSGQMISRSAFSTSDISASVTIPAGETVDVNVSAVALGLNGAGEKSVTNGGELIAENMDPISSNNITHIIESTGESNTSKGETSTGGASSIGSDNMLSVNNKTYKITGTAWLDKDKDGMRTESEELMKGVVATLVDSDNGIIKQSTTTNSKGEYTFTGVRNGNYIIIFDYDTVRYTVTVYQKENIAQNVNSDVITTKIEQDGKLRNGAVTRVVTVENVSVSNIDIGLVDALKFDLSLNMGISKITTNTSKGTDTKTYDNSKLTKTEIAAKQVAGSSVYVEYNLTVKNEGEVAGYAKKIADYLPEGMEFNSGMNQEWYTGSDGNLYTSQLANVEIQPGETKSFKLVLSKQLTDDNLGTVSNTAEIVEDYNIYGISDLDSEPSNKAQNEDDFARTDSYLSVKTGEIFIYISVIITTIILIGIGVALIVLKTKSKLIVKGGV